MKWLRTLITGDEHCLGACGIVRESQRVIAASERKGAELHRKVAPQRVAI